MAQEVQYKTISGNSPFDFDKALLQAAAGGWKPILLTSTSFTTPDGDTLSIVAIVEKR